jgi:hypothetical protein
MDVIEARPVHPALQLLLLLAPIALNGFFLVYALVGLVLEPGKDLDFWTAEALDVALWVTTVMLGYSALLHLIARWRGLRGWCLLNIAALAHALIALLLTAMVAALV